MAIRNFFHNLSQGPPNPGFMQKKVQKGDFLKKDSRELKKFSCFRFLWISWRPGTLNWERVVFLLSKIIYRKCVQASNTPLRCGGSSQLFEELCKYLIRHPWNKQRWRIKWSKFHFGFCTKHLEAFSISLNSNFNFQAFSILSLPNF